MISLFSPSLNLNKRTHKDRETLARAGVVPLGYIPLYIFSRRRPCMEIYDTLEYMCFGPYKYLPLRIGFLGQGVNTTTESIVLILVSFIFVFEGINGDIKHMGFCSFW